MENATQNQNELIITRIFDAPRDLVFKAWTDESEVVKWWGPKDYTCPVANIDLRVGGVNLLCMRSSEGKEFWSTGEYREIQNPSRLVVTDSFADEKGNPVPASYYDMPGDWPDELLVTLTFEEEDGKTKMTLVHAGVPEGEMKEQCETGWNESLDKLESHLGD